MQRRLKSSEHEHSPAVVRVDKEEAGGCGVRDSSGMPFAGRFLIQSGEGKGETREMDWWIKHLLPKYEAWRLEPWNPWKARQPWWPPLILALGRQRLGSLGQTG